MADEARATLDAKRAERKRQLEKVGRTPPKVIRTNDEAWRALPVSGLGEYYQAAFKLARQTGVQHWLVLHRFSDLRAAGDEGTRQQRLAEGLLADASTTIVFHQHAKEAGLTSELLGLSSTGGELIETLHQGEALWRVGTRFSFTTCCPTSSSVWSTPTPRCSSSTPTWSPSSPLTTRRCMPPARASA